MTEDVLETLRRQVISKFGKTGVDFTNHSRNNICSNKKFRAIQAFLLKLNSAEFDSLDSMCDSLAAIESGPEYGLSEKVCAKHLILDLKKAFLLLPDVNEQLGHQDFRDAEHAKSVIYSDLVAKRGRQSNGPLPHHSETETDAMYDATLKAWLCGKASDKVHKIRKQKPSETGIDDGAVTSGSGATHMSEGHREDKRYRPKDLNLVDLEDVKYLHKQLSGGKKAFTKRELKELVSAEHLENCQYRGKEGFLLRLKPLPGEKAIQHTFVVNLAKQLRERQKQAAKGQAAGGHQESTSGHTASSQGQQKTGTQEKRKAETQSPGDGAGGGSAAGGHQIAQTTHGTADSVGNRGTGTSEGHKGCKRQRSTQQALEDAAAQVFEVLKQVQPQVDVDAHSEKASAARQIKMQMYMAGIASLDALQFGPEHVESIRASLHQLQQEEAACEAAQKNGMIKAVDGFKQALCKLLQPNHSFLVSKFQ